MLGRLRQAQQSEERWPSGLRQLARAAPRDLCLATTRAYAKWAGGLTKITANGADSIEPFGGRRSGGLEC
jgi:hypothetical protein